MPELNARDDTGSDSQAGLEDPGPWWAFVVGAGVGVFCLSVAFGREFLDWVKRVIFAYPF